MTKKEIQEYNLKAIEEMRKCRQRAFEELYEGNHEGFNEWMRRYDNVKLISFDEAID